MGPDQRPGLGEELYPLPEEEVSGLESLPLEWRDMTDEEISKVIEELCQSKAAEFRMLGYDHVTPQEIWECVNDRYAKSGVPRLHQVVNDVLSLKVTQFMNWMTLSAYKGDKMFREPLFPKP